MVLDNVQLSFALGRDIGVKVMPETIDKPVKKSQTQRILELLQTEGTVTNKRLNRICFRYSARLMDLRKDGHKIVSNHVKDSLWEFSLMDERK